MPAFSSIHALSISEQGISSLAFNCKGEWLAIGCAAPGQLLVWEWRSETYVLKQQGHYQGIASLAFSPDGAHIATCADDAKARHQAVHNLGSLFPSLKLPGGKARLQSALAPKRAKNDPAR